MGFDINGDTAGDSREGGCSSIGGSSSSGGVGKGGDQGGAKGPRSKSSKSGAGSCAVVLRNDMFFEMEGRKSGRTPEVIEFVAKPCIYKRR